MFKIIGRDGGLTITVCISVLCSLLLLATLAANSYPPSTTHLIPALISFGGLSALAVFQHNEWFRFLTAIFLHGGPIHLCSNLAGLFFAGKFLERFVGRALFLVLFMVSGIGGGIASILLNPSDTVSVGASGGICGLLGASVFLLTRVQEKTIKGNLLAYYVPVIASQLFPLTIYLYFYVASAKTPLSYIDHAAHLGGLITGLVLGKLVLLAWPPFQVHPLFSREIFALALLLTGSTFFGWVYLLALA